MTMSLRSQITAFCALTSQEILFNSKKNRAPGNKLSVEGLGVGKSFRRPVSKISWNPLN